MDLKDELKAIAKEQGITFKELAVKAGVSENGLHNKFKRGSLTVKDLSTLLAVLGLKIAFVKKQG